VRSQFASPVFTRHHCSWHLSLVAAQHLQTASQHGKRPLDCGSCLPQMLNTNIHANLSLPGSLEFVCWCGPKTQLHPPETLTWVWATWRIVVTQMSSATACPRVNSSRPLQWWSNINSGLHPAPCVSMLLWASCSGTKSFALKSGRVPVLVYTWEPWPRQSHKHLPVWLQIIANTGTIKTKLPRLAHLTPFFYLKSYNLL
jgi:hypothetical protein